MGGRRGGGRGSGSGGRAFRSVRLIGSFNLVVKRFDDFDFDFDLLKQFLLHTRSSRFPPGRGNLDWEVGWGEEGEDLGGDVVAAVVHQFAKVFHNLLED